MSGVTLLDRIWDGHVIASADGADLLQVDRSLLTDLSGTMGLEDLAVRGRPVDSPRQHLGIPDHVVATAGPEPDSERYDRFVGGLRRRCAEQGITYLGRESGHQGIVHVTGLELGFSLPGLTVVCGDSHTSTHGAVGALAWGIGSTETEHVLATQTIWLAKPRQALVRLTGALSAGVSVKDVALWLIGTLGADFGREHAVEFAGPAVAAMSIEERATLCNLAVELGARFALVAPDERTFAYLLGRPLAPHGELWDVAVARWRALAGDGDAGYDKVVELDVGAVVPQVTWGITPEQVADVGGHVPAADRLPDGVSDYTGLRPGEALLGVPVDYVFIGSCANARIEDLRAAAEVLGPTGRVAEGVRAWVVPGSQGVARQARAEGLERRFVEAGFEWREPGCSMCVGVNGDRVPPGARCVSTSNRNFIGRQGPGSRTHLASPATAAACAVAGAIADPRDHASRPVRG